MKVKARSFVLSIFISLIVCSESGFSQSEREIPFFLPSQTLSLGDLLREIQDQSELNLSYNPEELPLDTLVWFKSKEQTLGTVLVELEKYNLKFLFLRDYLIINYQIKDTIEPPVPEWISIKGFVRDSATGEALIGANVVIAGTGKGTISNGYGFYSLRLKPGEQRLIFSYLGYIPAEVMLDLEEDQDLSPDLVKSSNELEEVKIYSSDSLNVLYNGGGNSRLHVGSLKKIPGFMGERDVIKSLQSIPGINFYSDGSTIFHVRGGARDQNLLLIDEAPVYNPAHLLGLFSVFSPDAVNSLNLYKGDIPARFGGRLSSVIDIKMKEGNRNRLVFSGNTGFIASSLNLEAPLIKKRGSFYFSGRRSHLKWLLSSQNPSIDQLHFSDFNLKSNIRLNNSNRIFLSFYAGNDIFRNRTGRFESSGIRWQNLAFSLRWNHVYGDRLFGNVSLIGSDYNYDLLTSYESNDRWNSRISLTALKLDYHFYVNPDNTVRFGSSLGEHSYYPGNYFSGDDPEPAIPGVPDKFSSEFTLYLSNEQKITSGVQLSYGLRLVRWSNKGETVEFEYNRAYQAVDTLFYAKNEVYHSFLSLEPRVSMSFQIMPAVNGHISYNRSSQFEYLITNSISPFTSMEIWLPAGPNIKPMFADQISGGIHLKAKKLPVGLDLDVFYKKMHNALSYEDHAYMLFNPQVESELRYGEGRSYGVEVLLKKDGRRWDGWISYAYTRSLVRIPDVGGDNYFPAIYDRPHNVSFLMNFRPGSRWEISTQWLYASGSPFTTPTGYYYYQGYQIPFYRERNNDRLPVYHRLDASVNFRISRLNARNEHFVRFSLFNLYARKNPFSIHFNKSVDEEGNIFVPLNRSEAPELHPTMMYVFGTVPSLTYHFRF